MASIRLVISNDFKQEHHEIEIASGVEEHPSIEISTVCLEAIYFAGDSKIASGSLVAKFCAAHQAKNSFDCGYGRLGGGSVGEGRIDIQIPQLQGIGLGSILMIPLIQWLQLRDDVPMVAISLSADDASTPEAKSRRNRFYEKLGFSFGWGNELQEWGESKQMLSSQLKVPAFQVAKNYSIKVSSRKDECCYDIEKLLLNLG